VARRTLRETDSTKMLLVDFVDMIVRDGIDRRVAHRAFMAVDEYLDSIAPDTAALRTSPLRAALPARSGYVRE
jgi:hypothetical protein